MQRGTLEAVHFSGAKGRVSLQPLLSDYLVCPSIPQRVHFSGDRKGVWKRVLCNCNDKYKFNNVYIPRIFKSGCKSAFRRFTVLGYFFSSKTKKIHFSGV